MNDLVVKSVDLFGDSIMAAKDKDGKSLATQNAPTGGPNENNSDNSTSSDSSTSSDDSAGSEG